MRHGDLPPLVFDCGTGARGLGFKLVGEPARELDLVFTHLHMDHVFGFPFFIPIYTPGYDVRVTVPAYSEDEAREKIARYLNGIYHPTRLRDLPANVTFHAVRPGKSFERSGYTLTGLGLNHPGGSVGYRVEVEGQSFAYITDTAPFAKPGDGVCGGQPAPPAEQRMIDFLKNVDVVIYDTMYDVNEYLEKMTWGHSYPEYAFELCKAANVGSLVLFHHRPDASDETMDELEAAWAAKESPFPIGVAKEGQAIQIPVKGT